MLSNGSNTKCKKYLEDLLDHIGSSTKCKKNSNVL